ncbi:MAG: hypothetical protein R3C04_01145 [Hyphomonas sp.]
MHIRRRRGPDCGHGVQPAPGRTGKDIVFAAFDPQNRAALASAMNALP